MLAITNNIQRKIAVFILETILMPYRASNTLALLIHEAGHAITLCMITGHYKCLSIRNILTPDELKIILNGLKPCRPLPQWSGNPIQILKPNCTANQCRIIAISGIIMNLISIIYSIYLNFILKQQDTFSIPMTGILQLLLMYFIISNAIAMLSIPDILAFIKGQTDYFACGPAFAIRYQIDTEKNSTNLASHRLLALTEILAREAATRGGQSGGFSYIAKKSASLSIIFDKVVKGKREDIVQVLCQRLAELLRKAKKEGYAKPDNFEAVLLHLRYATGGATHWHNAQPHWYEYYNSMMHHRCTAGQLISTDSEVFNMIAHNGDMDGVYLEFTVNEKRIRTLFTQMEARAIFLKIMPHSTSQGNSDSRSVGEWVDFHYTQGLAFKALRYAYFSHALDFNTHIVTQQFNLNDLYRWADIVDSTLIKAHHSTHEVFNTHPQSIADLSTSIKTQIRNALGLELNKTLAQNTIDVLLTAFEEAFYGHDLSWVMHQASQNLVGEFALMICTTLEPRMGVFSLTQAFSIGHNLSRGEIFGSAEPQGVTSALHSGNADDYAVQVNLEDGQYAIIEFIISGEKSAINIYDKAKTDNDYLAKPSPALNMQFPSQRQDCAWFPVNNNPKITRSTRHDDPRNEINTDIRDIPYALNRVVKSFHPNGENIATLQHLSQCIYENLFNPLRDQQKFDLVLFGVDFNQDLISEFAIAIQALLPNLKVRAENSGNVLKEIKRNHREGIGGYSDKTIFLGVSNSAQTQSTLAALRKAIELVGNQRCFVLTQSFLNSMTQALGQNYRPEDAILPNTFVNLSHLSPDGTSGRRRSEAATIVPVCTQAVLTEILIYLAQQALDGCWHTSSDNTARTQPIPIRHDLNATDLKAFRQFQAVVYEIEIPNRVGFNSAGEPINSPDTDIIQKEALARAENTIEFVRSYALFAAYIFVATVFGLPVFATISSPFQFINGINFIAHILDATLFLFALWLIHLGLRFYQGRPLFERIGARAELYIDRKYIARMVERYNATLFSNAPAFLSPFFYWADTVRDSLHRYGIRAHRGVVTIHRTPDERMGIEEANNAAEENMVFAQIGGIRFNHGQPQSRDKVRFNSKYMNKTAQDKIARPYQSVLSDSLDDLRNYYQHQLSPETFRLINRRLIDLSDGLIFEFVVGNCRKEIINRAIWDVIKWLPGSVWIYHLALNYGIDLKYIIGDADTANQAQIQSTKHPVSPIDVNTKTMLPRPTNLAIENDQNSSQTPAFAILIFYENHIVIQIHKHQDALLSQANTTEIILRPGKFRDKGRLVSSLNNREYINYQGLLIQINDQEYLDILDDQQRPLVSIALSHLSVMQQNFLKHNLKMQTYKNQAIAA